MAADRSPGTRMTENTSARSVDVSEIISGAAICGMQGYAERGSTAGPVLTVGMDDYEAQFGTAPTCGFPGATHMYDSAKLFFKQAGKAGKLYVNRTVSSTAAAASRSVSSLGGPGPAQVLVGGFPAVMADNKAFTITDTGSAHSATVTFRGFAAKATCTGGTYGAGASGDSITVSINGVPGEQVIDLSTALATAASYAAIINDAIQGARAVVATSNIEIITDQAGSGAGGSIVAVGGAAGTKLGIATSTLFVAGGANTVANIRAVTASEFWNLINVGFATYATITVSATTVTIKSLDLGAAAKLNVSGSAVAYLPFCAVQQYSGSDAASSPCLKINASSVGAWGNKVSAKVTRVARVVTTCGASVSGNASVTRIALASTNKLLVGDQVSFTTGVGTVRGIVDRIEGTSPPAIVLKVAVTVPSDGFSLTTPVTLETFDIAVYNSAGKVVKTFSRMSMDPAALENYFLNKVNADTRGLVSVELLGYSTSTDPRPSTDTNQIALSGGSDGSALTSAELAGLESTSTGIYAWDKVSDVDVVGIPGAASMSLGASQTIALLKEMESYLDARGDVFGVYDSPSGLLPNLDSGQVSYWVTDTVKLVSSQGGTWFPWLKIGRDDGSIAVVPPCGVVMGIISKAHSLVNIGKAPAGEDVGIVAGVLGTEYALQEKQYDLIYPTGVNGIYEIPNLGTTLWGNSTFDVDGVLSSVSSRIVFNKVKRFVKQSTRWVAFKPNDLITRELVKSGLEDSLGKLQTNRILYGTDPAKGYYIDLDDATLGTKYLTGKIGIRPTEAAEFIEFELYQLTAG